MLLWGAAAIGYVMAPLAWWERVLATAAALFLVAAIPLDRRDRLRARSASSIGIHVLRARGMEPKRSAT